MPQPRSLSWKERLRALGPGLITGAADDDPSGIATYAQTGAQFGFLQLWTAIVLTPCMIVVQEMVGRLGLVKGRGLATLIGQRYGRKILWFSVGLLLIANVINIGADIGAMAAVLRMLFGLPFVMWMLLVTAGTLLLEIVVSYRVYASYLRYLVLSLVSYVLVAFIVHEPWGVIARATIVPSFVWSAPFLMNIVALLGTTISPYLFFWQASEEVEEEVLHHKLAGMDAGRPRVSMRDVQRMRWDTAVGMVVSNTVMFFIIVASAATLGAHGVTAILTPDQAAQALRPLAGDGAYWLFAVGIIGTGLLAVPVLAGSVSYAIAEALGWHSGLYKKFKNAHGFYGVMKPKPFSSFLPAIVPFIRL